MKNLLFVFIVLFICNITKASYNEMLPISVNLGIPNNYVVPTQYNNWSHEHKRKKPKPQPPIPEPGTILLCFIGSVLVGYTKYKNLLK